MRWGKVDQDEGPAGKGVGISKIAGTDSSSPVAGDWPLLEDQGWKSTCPKDIFSGLPGPDGYRGSLFGITVTSSTGKDRMGLLMKLAKIMGPDHP